MRAARAWAKKTVSIRNAASRSAIAAPGSSGEAEKPPCYGWRMQGPTLRLETLSDDDLLARLADVLLRGRRVEAELVWHLAEVDRRRLYLREACPSMHVYATQRLRMSDAEAYLRITVARVSRRFPVVLALLADGRLHLSAIAKLAPHLGNENGEALLGRAVHKSRPSSVRTESKFARLAMAPHRSSIHRRYPPRRLCRPRRPPAWRLHPQVRPWWLPSHRLGSRSSSPPAASFTTRSPTPRPSSAIRSRLATWRRSSIARYALSACDSLYREYPQ